MRINKVLAEMGVASRRSADAMITAGRVQINGVTATLGMDVDEKDEIFLDGQKLIREEKKEEYYIKKRFQTLLRVLGTMSPFATMQKYIFF